MPFIRNHFLYCRFNFFCLFVCFKGQLPSINNSLRNTFHPYIAFEFCGAMNANRKITHISLNTSSLKNLCSRFFSVYLQRKRYWDSMVITGESVSSLYVGHVCIQRCRLNRFDHQVSRTSEHSSFQPILIF